MLFINHMRIIGIIVLLIFSTEPCHADLTTGLVGWWKLDEGSGTSATDSSGGGNTGTLTNGPTWTSGKRAAAVQLDGTNDYITVPHNATLAPATGFTVSIWFKTSTVRGDYLISKINGGQWSGYVLATNTPGAGSGTVDGTIAFWFGVNWVSVNLGAGSLSDNKFHHLVGTHDGSTAKIYLDGVLRNSRADSFSINGGVALTMGQHAFNGTYFNGTLDDARVYSRVLTDAEITELYKNYSFIRNAHIVNAVLR